MRKKFLKKTPESAPVDEQDEASVVLDEEPPVAADEAPKASLLARAAYKAFYGISYGAVFSSLLVAKLLIPKDSVVDAALHDGAVAARHDFEEKARVVAEVAEQTEEILSGEPSEEAPAVPA